jgi:hypothetical protein
MVTVHYGSGSDNMGDVYCNGKCRPDFGDIRFTDGDGTTVLSYWMESKIDSDIAVFWVKMASDLNSENRVLYLYYGNENVTTTGSGDNTFLFFDDFADTNVDINKWVIVGSPSVSQSMCTINTSEGIYTKSTFGPYNVAFRANVKTAAAVNNAVCSFGFGSNGTELQGSAAQFYVTNPVDYYFIRGVNQVNPQTWSSVNFDTPQNSNYRTWDIGWAIGQTSFRIDNSETRTLASNIPSSSLPIMFFSRATYTSTQYVDWVLVRQYVNPEPIHGSWGTEETLT